MTTAQMVTIGSAALMLLWSVAPTQGAATPLQNVAVQLPHDFRLTSAQERSVEGALSASQKRELNQVAQRLGDGASFTEVRASWTAVLSHLPGGDPMDVNALVQWVLRQSYLENAKDLQSYADKVRHFNEQKEAVRSDITRMRAHMSQFMSSRSWSDFRPDLSRWEVVPAHRPPAAITSSAEAEETLDRWENLLAKIDDDAHLANISREETLSTQQRLFQHVEALKAQLRDSALQRIQ